MITKRIGIIGCGNMGEALLGRLQGALGTGGSIMVSEADEARRAYLGKRYALSVTDDNALVAKESEVIILAVKPPMITKVLMSVARLEGMSFTPIFASTAVIPAKRAEPTA